MRRVLEEPLPFRVLWDCGISEYGEFACSRATFEWLRSGGMSLVDGRPVRLVVADECAGGNVIVHVDWLDTNAYPAGTYAWQEAA